MHNSESDDEISMIYESIQHLEDEIRKIDSVITEYIQQRKFLNHRLADLKYELRNKKNG